MRGAPALARWLLAAAVTFAAPARAQPAPATDPPDVMPQPSENASPPIPAEYLQEERGGLHFAYHPSARDGVRPLLEQGERIRDELRNSLGSGVLKSVTIRIAWGKTDLSRHRSGPGAEAAHHPAADTARPSTDEPPHGSSGHAPGAAAMVAIDLEAATREGSARPTELLRRELAELALREVAGARRLPRWLTVGFARSFAQSQALGERLALGWSLARGRLVPVRGLDVALSRGGLDEELGEAEAADWVGYLRSIDASTGGLSELVRHLADGEPAHQALPRSFGRSVAELEGRWRSDLARRVVFVPVLVGGLVLALVGVLLGHALGRIRRRKAARAKQLAHARQLAREQAARLMPVHVRLVPIEPDDAPLAAAMPLGARDDSHDPDVPRISHDGQWHTLH